MTGERGVRRRRWWRWAVTGWAVTVAVGGALTLLLQEDARPKGPYVWQNGNGPTPSPGRAGMRAWPPDENEKDSGEEGGAEEGGGKDACPPRPAPSATTTVLCLYASTGG
ncbi:hypothetical protein [Streptomyces sp. NPDC007205]|uniref:hypothetical protein n=1 Tax=Streptomyces sp. NPDC007205 TaxID=3154316 RepID=UPI0033F38CBA